MTVLGRGDRTAVVASDGYLGIARPRDISANTVMASIARIGKKLDADLSVRMAAKATQRGLARV